MTTTLDTAIVAASETWRVSRDAILNHTRSHVVCKARFSVYRWATCNAGLTYSETGRQLGRDHGSISNGLRKLEAWIQTDRHVRQEVDEFYGRMQK